ncbi:monooxygenase [Acrocarpospora phusangensis]|uniref:Monooxygenase n=1 Tax=Acrocarpospora phusangensis TaxID=1070424 RepID=A0A919Q9C3_9ACTN|nr:NAD(P)/FAD-dependent oxidoreductase [Acrocarpospora phusangensis]GIH22227.1 monooxygenase [Acrocarpospora phusangensis]
MPDYDVIVCGAGVGGLTLARALGRQGRRVLLLEKQQHAPPVHKGELLQPRSLHILGLLDCLDTLRAEGALTAERLSCRTADGDEIGALDYRSLPGSHPYCLVHNYATIKNVLTASLSAEIRYGLRADTLLHDSSGRVRGITAVGSGGRSEEITAALVVACDGLGSRLRTQAGIEVRREPYTHQLVGYDLADPGLGPDIAAHLTRDGLRLLFSMPGGRARLYAQVPSGQVRKADLAAWTDTMITRVPALDPVADALRESVPGAQTVAAWRYSADHWVLPGLALVGDAAHCVHPMAGQGMNAAIADAWTLAEQLTDLTPAAVDDALARYDAIRRPALEYVSRLSHNLAMLFTDTSWRTRVVGHYMLRRNQQNQRLQTIITYNMSGLGVQRFTLRDRFVQFGLLPDRGEVPVHVR